jgi:hypothetical protein
LVVVHIVGLEEVGVVRCCDCVSEHSSAESDVYCILFCGEHKLKLSEGSIGL